MSTVMSCIYSPLSALWSSLDHTTKVIGYSRAAAELTRLGYHEESKRCMLQIKEINND
jgi:hypothetical protein